jgi:hypothetical protein
MDIVVKIQLAKGARASSKLLAAASGRFPATEQAIAQSVTEAQRVMASAVTGRRVSWSGGSFTIASRTGGLAAAIQAGGRYPLGGNRLAGGIAIQCRYYQSIRDGIKPYDMKPGLLRSAKAKTSRKGIRYVIVPLPASSKQPWAARVFRIVTSQSKGWIHPGTLPRRLDLYTAEQMRGRTLAALRKAIAKDLGATR